MSVAAEEILASPGTDKERHIPSTARSSDSGWTESVVSPPGRAMRYTGLEGYGDQ